MHMVRTVTMWTDSGGGGKSTIALNAAHAISEKGKDVLVWDIDQQRGSLTDYIGFTDYLADDRANALQAVFDDDKTLSDVVLKSDDHDRLPFDLIPGTLQWEGFDKVLARERVPNEWGVFRKALGDANLPERYDVIIIDAEGRRGLKEKNAIVATQNVVMPIFPNRKGRNDVGSGRDYIFNRIQPTLAEMEIDMEFSLNAVVPTKVDMQKNVHQKTMNALRERDIPLTPFVMKDRGPYEAALDEQMTLFQYAESDDTRDLYDYEGDVLAKYEKLAETILTGIARVTA